MRLISICDYSKLDIREAAVPNSALSPATPSTRSTAGTTAGCTTGCAPSWAIASMRPTWRRTPSSGCCGTGRKSRLREPRAYLTAIAKRLMLNHHRRRALEQAYLDALAVMPPALAPSVEQRLLILEALHEIDEMLRPAGSGARGLLLAQLEGLSHGEIAARLDVSPRTVHRHIARGYEQCILAVACAGGRNGRAAEVERSVARQAARWMMLLGSGRASPSDLLACEQWRSSKAEHEHAWQRAQRQPALRPGAGHAGHGGAEPARVAAPPRAQDPGAGLGDQSAGLGRVARRSAGLDRRLSQRRRRAARSGAQRRIPSLPEHGQRRGRGVQRRLAAAAAARRRDSAACA